MDDVVLAQMLRSGDLGATASVFDRYSHELYHYAVFLLDDEEPAAEAVHCALLVAVGWAAWLVDPAKLRLWLFALVRNECLRRRAEPASRRPRGGAHSPRGFVQRSGGSAEALREVFELVHRHLLEDREVAAVIGVSPRRARSMRARGEVAFSGRGVAFMPYRASRRPDPPAGLRERVLASVAAPGRVAHRAEVAAPRRRSGFPVPLDSVALYRRMRALRGFAAVGTPVLVLALLLVVPSMLPDGTALHLARPNRTAVPTPGDDVQPLDGTEPVAATPSGTASPFLPPTGTRTPRSIISVGAGEAGQLAGRPSIAAPEPKAKSTPQPKSPPRQPVPVPKPQPRPLPAPQPRPQPQPRTAAGAIVGLAGKCLDVRNSDTAPGTAVTLFSCNGTGAQRWTHAADGSLRALGNCADLTASRPGAPIVMRRCDGSASQRWTRSGLQLVNLRAKMCLDVPGFRTADSTQVIVWGCNGQQNQQWRLRLV